MTKRRPPKRLKEAGSEFWSAIFDEYGIADSGGLQLAATAGKSLDRMREAQKIIQKHGLTVETSSEGVKINPAAQVERDSKNGFLAAERTLNLDLEPLHDQPGRPAGKELYAVP